jgi:hypothetical protein
VVIPYKTEVKTMLKVQNGSAIFYVKDKEKIKFWRSLAAMSSSGPFKHSKGGVRIIKEIKEE